MSIDIDAVSMEELYSFGGGLTKTRLLQGSGEPPFISIFSNFRSGKSLKANFAKLECVDVNGKAMNPRERREKISGF